MYRHFHGAQVLRVLFPSLLLVIGCAPSTSESTTPCSNGPVIEHSVGDGRYVTLDALPSAATAELLPPRARYRVVLGNDGTLALVIVAPDQRILGRLHIALAQRLRSVAGTQIDYEDIGGRATRVEAWSRAGTIDGHATVGDRSARFRVRLGADGSLAGERWSAGRGDWATPELLELRRAQAIRGDLGAITAQVAGDETLADHDRRELGELLALAELALDLSIRAWAGEGRAQLPGVDAYVPERLCGL